MTAQILRSWCAVRDRAYSYARLSRYIKLNGFKLSLWIADGIWQTDFLLDGLLRVGVQFQKLHTKPHTGNAVPYLRANIDDEIHSAKAKVNFHNGTFG